MDYKEYYGKLHNLLELYAYMFARGDYLKADEYHRRALGALGELEGRIMHEMNKEKHDILKNLK